MRPSRREYRTLTARTAFGDSAISRRPDPARIHEARRAATIRRLEMSGMSAEGAESWVARGETMADTERRPPNSAYWMEAWDWITVQQHGPPSLPVWFDRGAADVRRRHALRLTKANRAKSGQQGSRRSAQ
jgi:hypothetical protein